VNIKRRPTQTVFINRNTFKGKMERKLMCLKQFTGHKAISSLEISAIFSLKIVRKTVKPIQFQRRQPSRQPCKDNVFNSTLMMDDTLKIRVFTFRIPHAKAMKSYISFARHVHTHIADQFHLLRNKQKIIISGIRMLLASCNIFDGFPVQTRILLK
jgi:hypothetical protein